MATFSKRFLNETEIVNFLNGGSSDTFLTLTKSQIGDLTHPTSWFFTATDNEGSGNPTIGDKIYLTIAGVEFSYTVLSNDTSETVATAFKTLIDAEIAANPGGAVDVLITSPTTTGSPASFLNLIGKVNNVNFTPTKNLDPVILTYIDSKVVISSSIVARGINESWVLFYN